MELPARESPAPGRAHDRSEDRTRPLKALARAGHALRALPSGAAILDAAAQMVCEISQAEACLIFAEARGDAPVRVAQWEPEAILTAGALEVAARRALTAGSASETRLTSRAGGLLSAVSSVVSAGEGRWVLFAVRRAAEDSALTQAALDAAAALVEAHLGRVEGAGAPEPAAPAGAQTSGRFDRSEARICFEDLLGEDPSFLQSVELARRAAASDMPILVTGETGTGKEMIAQAIHSASARAAEPFVGINVAAIPRELLESELFGYERGAFTGARAAGKPGLFEVAGAGTLLLDEIGDMSLDLQVKILRVLQERVVQRVGGTRSLPIRARIVATTHRDLRRASEEGVFRADLYYRIRGVHVRVPALRDRSSDIPLLVETCLARWAARAGRPKPAVDRRVLAAYREHDWPGNVRELMHLVEAEASVLAPGETTIRRMPTISQRVVLTAPPPSSRPPATPREIFDTPPHGSARALSEIERQAYKEALERHGGNVTQAARALGVSRSTIYLKMRRYGLEGG